MKTKNVLFLVLLAAITADLLIPWILSHYYYGYNTMLEPISALGAGNSPVAHWAMINLLVVGSLFLIYSAAEWIHIFPGNNYHRWYLLSIFIYGLTCIVAGIYPEDMKNAAETTSGKIHGIVSGIGFILLTVHPLIVKQAYSNRWKKYFNVLIFLIATHAFVFFLISKFETEGWMKYTGFYQRVNLLVLYIGLMVNHLWLHKKVMPEPEIMY